MGESLQERAAGSTKDRLGLRDRLEEGRCSTRQESQGRDGEAATRTPGSADRLR